MEPDEIRLISFFNAKELAEDERYRHWLDIIDR